MALFALPLLAQAAMFDATVVAVSDGDTITVTVPKPCEPGESCFKGKKATGYAWQRSTHLSENSPMGLRLVML